MGTIERKLLIFGAWCGVAFTASVMVGLGLIAGFIPPVSPSAPGAEVTETIRSNSYAIRIGMIFMMFAAAPAIFFAGALAHLISKIEGQSRILTYTILIAGLGNALLVFYPALWWLIAAYRPERGVELTYMLSDAAWLQFVGGLFIAWPMMIVLAIAAFVEDGEKRYLSRWFGYLCAWGAVILLPTEFLFFVKSGPFAWDGLLAFYIPLSVFFIWWASMIYYIRKAGKEA